MCGARRKKSVELAHRPAPKTKNEPREITSTVKLGIIIIMIES